MDIRKQADARRATQRLRRAPQDTAEIVVPFDSQGRMDDANPQGSVLLTVEVTNPEGELADWFDVDWWSETISAWGNLAVTVRIAPTPSALLHPVVLQSMMMLRRVVPQWRLVGLASGSELLTDDAVEQLATSAFHEVRFTPTLPEDSLMPEHGNPLTIDELFGRIREFQVRKHRTHPILVRLPAGKADSPFIPIAGEPTIERHAAPSNQPSAIDSPSASIRP